MGDKPLPNAPLPPPPYYQGEAMQMASAIPPPPVHFTSGPTIVNNVSGGTIPVGRNHCPSCRVSHAN